MMTPPPPNLPKIPLATSAGTNPFSSGAAFLDIGEFVERCFPKGAVQGWGTLFVISDDLEDLAEKLALKTQDVFLIDDSVKFDEVRQRVIFVARCAPSAVVSPEYSSLKDARNAIDACHHSSAAAVLIHTSRSPRLHRFFWEGVAKPGNVLTTQVGGEFAKLVLSDFSEALTWVDENSVCPAGNVGYLWQDPGQHIPQKDAERRVQNLLRNGLASVLGKSYVIEEASNAAGRADLVILPPSGQFPTNYIELKVVRSYHSVNNPKVDKPTKVYKSQNGRWILSAIRQAAAYRGKNSNAHAQARIYDMREDRSQAIPHPDAVTAAAKRNVTIGFCSLFADTASIQEAAATAVP